MNEKPNCYECKWRRPIAGDAHSSCAHPDEISVLGNHIGVEGGWFFFPFNFDPRWLISCTGYTPKEEKP